MPGCRREPSYGAAFCVYRGNQPPNREDSCRRLGPLSPKGPKPGVAIEAWRSSSYRARVAHGPALPPTEDRAESPQLWLC